MQIAGLDVNALDQGRNRTGIQLGIIEGFYGRPWTWQQRESNVAYLARHGYSFYIYAPKADPYLRTRWRERHPEDIARNLAALGGWCRTHGVRFGIGLSPSRLHEDFGTDARAVFARKIAELASFGVDDFALLFDDMRGDVPDLAARQVAIVHEAAKHLTGKRIIMCPSYYSDDPVLDRVFGARPAGYLDQLGAMLDPSIDVFWTGEEICSREISVAHIARVAETLRRNPFLWDNYPVNDGARMSQYLHLRAFTGRTAALRGRVAAHGINPALQPVLSRIPALALAELYRSPETYAYGAAFREAAREVLGPELAQLVYEDLLLLQDVGLDRLEDKAQLIRSRYSEIDHDGAREIIAWLDGEYRITDEIVRAQAGE